MVILDSHILVWYVDDELHDKLTMEQLRCIAENVDGNLGISIVSLWEIAEKFKLGKLELYGGKISLSDWFRKVLEYQGITLLDIKAEMVLDSVDLPGNFHNDPFDQLIVSTARYYDCSLLTRDQKIRAYPFVKTI